MMGRNINEKKREENMRAPRIICPLNIISPHTTNSLGGSLSVKDAAVGTESERDEERVGGCGGVGV